MGLMLSVLVGCVGVLELLACLRHVSRSALVTLNPPTPCLSYHDQEIENQSTHDSLCNFSHSSDVWLPRSAKRKLENLHEYSLRIRSELRSIDKSYDGSTYSEWSAGDYLGSRSCSRSCSRPDSRHDSRPASRLDSRLSPDYDYVAHENALWNERGAIQDGYDELEEERKAFAASMQARLLDVEASRASTTLIAKETQQYVRIPTPIPFALGEEISRSPSSSEISLSNDSGNEAPTKEIFDVVPTIGRQRRESMENGSSVDESDLEDQELVRQILLRRSVSISPEPPRPTCKEVFTESTLQVSRSTEVLQDQEIIPSVLIDLDLPAEEQDINQVSSHKKTKSSKSSTSILRKPTRLKSRNAEISKSAENLSGKTKSKRHREPDRRKSEIVIQKFRDEWTNTSPPGSTPSLSRSESKRSVSVEVQTSFEEKLNDEEALVEYEDSVVGLAPRARSWGDEDDVFVFFVENLCQEDAPRTVSMRQSFYSNSLAATPRKLSRQQ